MGYTEGDLASIGAGVLFGGGAGALTGTMVAGPAGTIPGAVVGALIGLINKNLALLLLIIPLLLTIGLTSIFSSIPWYVWGAVVLVIIILLIPKK